MGKDQELLQAVKTEDLLTVQKLLQRPRPGKASESPPLRLVKGALSYVCVCVCVNSGALDPLSDGDPRIPSLAGFLLFI